MAVAGLALPGTTPSLRARFIALLFDSLNPADATPLPPLLTGEDDLRASLGNVARA